MMNWNLRLAFGRRWICLHEVLPPCQGWKRELTNCAKRQANSRALEPTP